MHTLIQHVAGAVIHRVAGASLCLAGLVAAAGLYTEAHHAPDQP